MTRDEFINLTAAYGASPDRWPEDVRDNGRQFMANHNDAIDLAAPQRVLDQLLDTNKATPDLGTDLGTDVSAQTLKVILDIPTRTRQKKPRRWAFGFDLGFMVPRLAGMTAMAVIGFYVGLSDLVVLPSQQSDPAIYDLTYLVFDTLPQENS